MAEGAQVKPPFERALEGLPPKVRRMHAKTPEKVARETDARSRVAAALGVPASDLEGVAGAAGMMITIALEMRADGLADDDKATRIVADALALARGDDPSGGAGGGGE